MIQFDELLRMSYILLDPTPTEPTHLKPKIEFSRSKCLGFEGNIYSRQYTEGNICSSFERAHRTASDNT